MTTGYPMKTPSRHPIILSAAFAAALCLPASAQNDAAFAAALGKLPAGLATMAQLKTRPQVPPSSQAQGPVAPAAAWQKLLDLVAGRGQRTVDPATKAVSCYLERSGEPDGQIYAITAAGRILPDGKVSVHTVLLRYGQTLPLNTRNGLVTVYEDWFLEVQGDGRLKKITYVKVESAAGNILESPPTLEDMNSEDMKSLFSGLVQSWTE